MKFPEKLSYEFALILIEGMNDNDLIFDYYLLEGIRIDQNIIAILRSAKSMDDVVELTRGLGPSLPARMSKLKIAVSQLNDPAKAQVIYKMMANPQFQILVGGGARPLGTAERSTIQQRVAAGQASGELERLKKHGVEPRTTSVTDTPNWILRRK